jgi:hypothetical protein
MYTTRSNRYSSFNQVNFSITSATKLTSIYTSSIDGNDKKTSIYEIDVEIDDILKDHLKNFIFSSNSLQEIASLDTKVKNK